MTSEVCTEDGYDCKCEYPFVHRYEVQMTRGNLQKHTDHGDRRSGGRGEHKEQKQEVRNNG